MVRLLGTSAWPPHHPLASTGAQRIPRLIHALGYNNHLRSAVELASVLSHVSKGLSIEAVGLALPEEASPSETRHRRTAPHLRRRPSCHRTLQPLA